LSVVGQQDRAFRVFSLSVNTDVLSAAAVLLHFGFVADAIDVSPMNRIAASRLLDAFGD
jgi:hypothetical protein